MARRYNFTYRELVDKLGVNPSVAEDYLETRESVVLNVEEIQRLDTETQRLDGEVIRVDGEVQRVDGEVDQLQTDLQQTNQQLQDQIDALEQTNQQIENANGEITNLQEAVRQNNDAIQNNSTAIQQTNDAVTVLQGRHYVDTPVANTDPLPAAPSFRANVLDSTGTVVGFIPIYT